MGWGNVVLSLSDIIHRVKEPRVYKTVLEDVRGFTLKGITITDDPNEEKVDYNICINPYFFEHVHTNIPHFLEPTSELMELVQKYAHNATYGMHIRRGAYSQDSEDMGCHGREEDGTIKRAYFANDDSVQRFMTIVEQTNDTFYLASDSRDIKKEFKQRFGDRIICLDIEIALTYDCATIIKEVSRVSQLNCYLDWYLLSLCKKLFVTGGTQGKPEISTFGYSAGMYGRCDIEMIFN